MTFVRKIKVAAVIILFSIQSPVSAQVNRPPDRMKMLSAFNGEWKGEMVEMQNKKKIKTKIAHTSMKVAGGWGVQISEAANLPDKTKYVSVKIFSYSPTGDTTYMYVVDNKGATYFYTGTWKGTKHLDLKFMAMDDKGKDVKKEVSYDFLSMREYNYKFTTTIGDSLANVVEMNMKKQ
ncbi:MAG: hypothetical protein ACHQNT_08475 [Bacteroidia bacterium]